jgi:hypothetical protein
MPVQTTTKKLQINNKCYRREKVREVLVPVEKLKEQAEILAHLKLRYLP